MKNVLKTRRASDVSLEELLAFERLLSDLSARFANVSGEQVVAEIEIALKQLLKLLDFDRGNFVEFTDEGKQEILCSVVLGRVELLPLGPVPPHLSWFVGELLAGRTVIIRSYEDFPPEAAAAAIAVLAFAPSLSFRCPSAAVSWRRLVSDRSVTPGDGQRRSWRA